MPASRESYIGGMDDSELLDYAAVIGKDRDSILQSIACSLFIIARHIVAELGGINGSKADNSDGEIPFGAN